MKKIIGFMLIVMMLCNQIVVANTEAAMPLNEAVISCETEYLDNGDMIVTIISCYNSGIETMANYQTKTATKKKLYKNASDEVLWSLSVTGTFRYDYGVSSECISASASVEEISSVWSVHDVEARRSRNSAIATASGTRYFLFVPVETIDLSVTLTCSNTGVLS